MRDAVVAGVYPFKEIGQCINRRAEKRENNGLTHREIPTELRACREGDHIVEAKFVKPFPKEIPHVYDLFRGGGSRAGPGRGHRRRRERETLRGTINGHLCNSSRVLAEAQLTESARVGS